MEQDHSVEEGSAVPSVKKVVAEALDQAPRQVRRSILTSLAVIGWIGLPSTVISTLSSLQWVIDAGRWLYDNAGVLQPVVTAVGAAVSFIVSLWRSLTHPVWEMLAAWIGLALPPWAPDTLTLLTLCAMGAVRRILREMWAGHMSGTLMLRGVDRSRAPDAVYSRLPRRFPYQTKFAEYGVRWTPRRLADTQRLWKHWRDEKIRVFLLIDGSRWPLVREEVTEAQFGRYWLGVTDGRRELTIYLAVAAGVLAAYLIDWWYP